MERVNCVFQSLRDVFPRQLRMLELWPRGEALLIRWDIKGVNRVVQRYDQGYVRISAPQSRPGTSSAHSAVFLYS